MKTILQRLLDFMANVAGPSTDAPLKEAPPGAVYGAFTTEFDVVVSGQELASRPSEFIETVQSGVNEYAALDLAVVMRMSAELRSNCATLSTGLREAYAREMRDDLAVTLLFDQSGSLRGENAILVAETAEALADALTAADIATEILGFTTSRWRGGRSRQKWLAEGRSSLPGRLNDLLHVVYLDSSDGVVPGPHTFPAMRIPYLPKENIDGEALQWAGGRLDSRRQKYKILIVVSDGAPVDDATLLHNWSRILYDHLIEVSARIYAEGRITLGGIGLDYDIRPFYRTTCKAKPTTALAHVAPVFVEEMIGLAFRKAST